MNAPSKPPSEQPVAPRLSTWQRVGLLLGIVLGVLVAFAPTELRGIEDGRAALTAGVVVLMACWWFSEALPISWTAGVPLVLFPLFGVFGRGLAGDVVETAQPYVSPYVFLFLGGMAIGAAMEQWNLHRRVALHIMSLVGTEPRRLLLGVLAATAVVSLWISNTATAVMMLPIALALVRELELARGGRRLPAFGTAVMLAVAYGANVGGIGTKIGTGTNSIFCGFLEKRGIPVSFVQYTGAALPFVFLFIPVVWGVLWLVARADRLESGDAEAVLERELSALGVPSRGERKVAVVFALAALLWVFADPMRGLLSPLAKSLLAFKLENRHYEMAVALLAAGLLLAWRAVSFASLKRIPYSTLVLLGGSFSMAHGIEKSGLAAWLGSQLALVSTLSLASQVLLASTATVFLSAVASNVATINIVLNVLPASTPVLFSSAVAASCDFMLPAGTPPNAIVFGSGYVRLGAMMRVGFWLDLAAAVLIAAYVLLYARFWF